MTWLLRNLWIAVVVLGSLQDPGVARADEGSPSSLTYVRVLDGRGLSQGSFALTTTGSYSYTEDLFGDGSKDSQFGARVAVLGAPLDNLMLGVGFGTLANHHELRTPQVSQTVGDPSLILRGGALLMPWLSLGGQLEVLFPTDGSGFGLAWQAVSPELTLAAGYHAPFGLNASLNLGARWRRSELAFTEPLEPVLRYSAQVANTPSVDVGLGVDYRIAVLEILSLAPFVETTFDAPVVGVDTSKALAGYLGAGLRVGLGREDMLLLTAAGELAYLRPDPIAVDVPAVPPWAVNLGVAYRFDPFARPGEAVTSPPPPLDDKPKEVIKEVVKEVAPPTGRIQGTVVDVASRSPVVDAVVEVVGAESSPLTVNGADGTFVTFPLAANRPVKLKAVAAGYDVGEANAMVGADAVRTIEISLTKTGAAQFGEIRGNIKGADGGPLEASIVITGLKDGRFKTDKATGAFSFQVPVGDHSVAVGAAGYRTQKKKIRIRPGDVVILNVDLAK
ncbi:MAG: carboxypeptidase-like regulatory domain-containing protein [Pseudomonadota bacterium]